ncbi:MAG: succinate dehydrogenase iron-sulfur subunit [Pseudomonadota bacterium]
MRFRIYRYQPDQNPAPYLQDFELADVPPGLMLREALLLLKQQDESLTFRHSCGEGVCGSDGVHVNGQNRLACITPVADLSEPIEIHPLPGRPVIRDLVVDMTQFFEQYRAVKPYLIRTDPMPEIEIHQSPEDRDQLDGLWECILCGCCSTACPSFWWNPGKFHGPAALLQAWRFLADSRDQATDERLDALEGPYRLFRCHTIMNCVEACPKGLNPARAIGHIKAFMLRQAI